MKRIEYTLTQDLIELNHLLKHTGFADSGGSGGALVSTGVVKVDGQIELRKRNKIRAGQVVQIADSEIYVLAGSAEAIANSDIKAEKKPFAKPVAKSGAKPAAKHGAKPFAKSGAKPGTKPAAKSSTKSGAKPDARPDPKPHAKPDARPDPKPHAKPDARPDPKPNAKPNAKPDAKPDTKPAPSAVKK